MKKRIAAIAVWIAMLSLLVSVPAAADSVDADTKAYAEAEKYHTVMTAVGAADGTIKNYAATLSRGELIQRVVRLSGYTADMVAADSSHPPYTDVTGESEFYDDVAAAYALGYLTEDSGALRLKDQATVADAMQMLVNLLGYGRIAKEGNITPEVMANRIGIRTGVKGAPQDALTNADLVTMMYHALFTNVMEPERFGDTVKYRQREPLLTAAFSIRYGTGIVEANPITSIYASTGCKWGNVRIDNVNYQSDAAFFDRIGHNVDYYYKENNGIYSMVYMTDCSEDDVFTVDTDDLESLKEMRLTYTDARGKQMKKAIDRSASFLYNGKLKKFSDIKTDTLTGSICLVDNDNDSVADVVSIVSYQHIVIRGVDAVSNKIFGRSDGEVYELENRENERIVQLLLDGQPVAVSDLKIDDVISVAASDTERGVSVVKAYVCRKSVTGSVVFSDEEEITVEDTTARFEKGYIEPNITGYGTFRFAFSGKIVFADLENYVVYGYLYKIRPTGIDGFTAKIFTDKGRWVELTLCSKVVYNGERMAAKDVVDAAELNGENGFLPQLVSYRVNPEGKIRVLDTAKKVTRWSKEEETAIENGDFRLSLQKASGTFRTPLSAFDMEVSLNASTYIFVVPGKYGDSDIDMDEVKLKSVNSLQSDNSYKNLYFYDVSRTGSAPVMVLYDNINRLSTNSPAYPVSDVGKGLNADGMPCDTVAVMVDGFELCFAVKDGAMPDKGVKKGDMIRYAANDDGEMAVINLLYRPNDADYDGLCSGGAYNRDTLIAGTLEYVDYENNRVVLRYGENRALLSTASVSTVYLYHKRGTIEKLEKTDLMPGKTVFIRARYAEIKEAMMYED